MLIISYDNIYHVLSGSKTFTLVSPTEGLWLEREYGTSDPVLVKDLRAEGNRALPPGSNSAQKPIGQRSHPCRRPTSHP